MEHRGSDPADDDGAPYPAGVMVHHPDVVDHVDMIDLVDRGPTADEIARIARDHPRVVVHLSPGTPDLTCLSPMKDVVTELMLTAGRLDLRALADFGALEHLEIGAEPTVPVDFSRVPLRRLDGWHQGFASALGLRTLEELGEGPSVAELATVAGRLRRLSVASRREHTTLDVGLDLSELRAVDIWGPERFDLGWLASAPRLRRLTMEGVGEITGLSHLHDCPELDWLSLHDCPVVDDLDAVTSLRGVPINVTGTTPFTRTLVAALPPEARAGFESDADYPADDWR
ncbi:hypothetical protein [Solicola sp. PLA-1-18]|uniref:hypothetical protein n=1 Tax=Solicola sp. PLA-1-18 TaxID=3380532 RepID=UPI003B7F3F07